VIGLGRLVAGATACYKMVFYTCSFHRTKIIMSDKYIPAVFYQQLLRQFFIKIGFSPVTTEFGFIKPVRQNVNYLWM